MFIAEQLRCRVALLLLRENYSRMSRQAPAHGRPCNNSSRCRSKFVLTLTPDQYLSKSKPSPDHAYRIRTSAELQKTQVLSCYFLLRKLLIRPQYALCCELCRIRPGELDCDHASHPTQHCCCVTTANVMVFEAFATGPSPTYC
jgi:hypothetical protein